MLELDSQTYLWGLGSHGTELAHKAVLISSHGIGRVFNSTFNVPPDTTVVFLGPEGTSLLDPGFRRAAGQERGISPYEIFGPGTVCPDYSLTKYQGYHQHTSGAIFGILAKPFLSNGTETYQDIEQFLQTSQRVPRQEDTSADAMDIVTIRYRPGRISTTLSAVISVLRAKGYRYEFIFCCFCRGIRGSHNAATNRMERNSSRVRLYLTLLYCCGRPRPTGALQTKSPRRLI